MRREAVGALERLWDGAEDVVDEDDGARGVGGARDVFLFFGFYLVNTT